MSTTVFINAMDLTEYAYKKLPCGTTAFDSVIKSAESLPDLKKIVIIARKDFIREGNFSIIEPQGRDMHSLIRVFQEEIGDSENLFYLYGDAPLLNSAVFERMYRNHNQYFASYTFADGFPYGMAPEIIKGSVLDQLLGLAEKNSIPISRKSLFELIKIDINSFDIETEISRIDQRMLRVSLTADTKRNYNQLCRIMDNLDSDSISDEDHLIDLLETSQILLRTEPSFINVQITGGCYQTCSYCPYPDMGGDIINRDDEMSIDQWIEILEKVGEFSDDAVFSVSLWGEPSRHSNFLGIVSSLLEREKFRLIIETSGIGWDPKIPEAISKISQGRVDWILSIDADNAESYSRVRGDGWDEVVSTAEYLHELFPENLYLQLVRMKAEEEHLENFYRGWKEKGYKMIIQKYDHFCKVLPDRRVTDLSPVRRFPCWHLKRDLNILIDGTVPLCREDLKKKYKMGNIFKDKIDLIWKNGESVYINHLNGEYSDLCRGCDEYYTYNF